MDGMVLAAGLGTRLRPLTDELPKALVPVGDRPALFHALDALVELGCARLVVNAHHHARAIERAAGARALVSNEEELLGTAGGLARARRELGLGDVLVWNGDMFGALTGELTLGGAEAALACAPRAKGEGNVGVSAEGRVVRLRSASFGEEARGGDFLGVHLVGGSLELPERGCLVGDVYIPALAQDRLLRAVFTDPLIDLGTLAGYLASNRAWLRGRKSYLGPGASASCALEECVLGEGARAEGEGTLARSVVWPGAIARAPLADAVVTPRTIAR